MIQSLPASRAEIVIRLRFTLIVALHKNLGNLFQLFSRQLLKFFRDLSVKLSGVHLDKKLYGGIVMIR